MTSCVDIYSICVICLERNIYCNCGTMATVPAATGVPPAVPSSNVESESISPDEYYRYRAKSFRDASVITRGLLEYGGSSMKNPRFWLIMALNQYMSLCHMIPHHSFCRSLLDDEFRNNLGKFNESLDAKVGPELKIGEYFDKILMKFVERIGFEEVKSKNPRMNFIDHANFVVSVYQSIVNYALVGNYNSPWEDLFLRRSLVFMKFLHKDLFFWASTFPSENDMSKFPAFPEELSMSIQPAMVNGFLNVRMNQSPSSSSTS